jgi:hypothetical protein
MSDLYSEIEYKWAADHLTPDRFMKWAIDFHPFKYESSSCPDIYYVNGNNTIRHRWSGGGAGEITVKQRKSAKSITDRVEVDLTFGDQVSIKDVTTFLTTCGWKRLFTLYKEHVNLFWFEDGGATVTVALYAVKKFNDKTRKCDKPKQFLEVEVEKGSKVSDAAARVLLEKWRDNLEVAFNLGATPLNRSLFEIYSGKTYAFSKGHAHGSAK